MEGYRIDRFGSVDGVVLRSSEDPRPGLREVMMRVRASLLNYRDLRTGLWAERSASRRREIGAYPILPCSDLTRNAPGARTSPRCRPLRAGSAADVQRRRPPVGG